MVIIVNIVCALLQHYNILKDKQTHKVIKVFSNDELSNGNGLNQETIWNMLVILVRALIMVL